MKYIKQFGIILIICTLGECLRFLIPLPIPASIYGLLLLFFSLQAGIIKPPQIEETAGFLVEIMPLMFIPAAAGLLSHWGSLQAVAGPLLLTVLITTVVVMAVTGLVTQTVVRKGRKVK